MIHEEDLGPEILAFMARIQVFVRENIPDIAVMNDSRSDIQRLEVILASKAFGLIAAMDSGVDAKKVNDFLNTDAGASLVVALILSLQGTVRDAIEERVATMN